MSKNNEKNNDNSWIFVVLCAVVVICVIAYIAYLMLKDNIVLNSNEIVSKEDIILDEKIDDVDLSDENVIAKKQITYEYVEIANYTSTLYDSSQNRKYNITYACSILNDTVVSAGEEFSFNNTIGPMDEASGFKIATGFDSDGNLINVSGGGMCQVSSTLYNVALLANLEITERHAHSRRVNYVPAGKDATVYYPTLDLKFINNSGSDIKITSECDGYTVTIRMYKIEQSN